MMRLRNEQSKDFGILAIELYLPSKYVCQKELETYDNASPGKYTEGLGQEKMSFCDDREDINSVCLTVVDKLMKNNSLSYQSIGRLEVGSETMVDKSKSIKTVLMQLFEESGNSDVEGLHCTNACYGATSALFNSIAWMESSSWDGRCAIVVAADIAVYGPGPARPTGGAGAIALLLGPNAPLVLDPIRSTHMEHSYDFYKPHLASEYPEVNGKESLVCYFRSMEICYEKYTQRCRERNVSDADYMVFHCPFTKMVKKAFARLAFVDPANPEYEKLNFQFGSMPMSETYLDKTFNKTCIKATEEQFKEKVQESLYLASQVGNMYTASLFGGLISLLSRRHQEMVGKRILLYSYGSGSSSSIFSFVCKRSVSEIAEKINLDSYLLDRIKISPEEYTKTLLIKERSLLKHPYTPIASIEHIRDGAFYLDSIDEKFRRKYQQKK